LELIRWSLRRALRELGISRDALARRLTEYGIAAGQDGCWLTQQIYKTLTIYPILNGQD
jgi:hypothetical protein